MHYKTWKNWNHISVNGSSNILLPNTNRSPLALTLEITDLYRSFQKERLRGLYRGVLETVSVVKTGNCSESSDVCYLPPTHTHLLQPGNFNICFSHYGFMKCCLCKRLTLQIMYFKIIIWIIISI